VLNDDVQPSLDLLSFYLQATVTIARNNALAAGAGAISILVPFTQTDFAPEPMWVHTYSVYIPVGAATTDITSAALTLVDPTSNAVHSILTAEMFSVPIAGANRFVALSCGGFWRGAGVSMGAIIACNAAGTNLAPQFTLRFSPTRTE